MRGSRLPEGMEVPELAEGNLDQGKPGDPPAERRRTVLVLVLTGLGVRVRVAGRVLHSLRSTRTRVKTLFRLNTP